MAQMLQARFGAALALSALLLAAVFMMQLYTPLRLTTSLLGSFLGALEEYNTDLDSLPSSSTTRSAVEVVHSLQSILIVTTTTVYLVPRATRLA